MSPHFLQCHMSNFRKGYVPCEYNFYAPIACHLALCRMPNLRKGCVALWILGVAGHLYGPNMYDVIGHAHNDVIMTWNGPDSYSFLVFKFDLGHLVFATFFSG